MNNEISLEEMNGKTIELGQALLGAVSPNFRMVTLEYDHGLWRFTFVLERDDPEDREEIKEVAYAFDALQETNINYKVEIEVTDEVILMPKPSWAKRVVFRRREYR